MIVPLLDMVVIAPALATPATPITVRANENVPPPALIVPPAALVSVAIIPVLELAIPALRPPAVDRAAVGQGADRRCPVRHAGASASADRAAGY